MLSPNVGLMLFLIVLGVDQLAVLVDFGLYANGWQTITDTASKYPWLTVVILAVQVAGLYGLASHLLNRSHP